MQRPSISRPLAAALAFLALVPLAACGSSDGAKASNASSTKSVGEGDAAGARELVGTFEIEKGACASGAAATGSYFRMVFPAGTLDKGKFFENPDSACGDKTFTLFVPGKDGGLKTGEFQPHPDPAFDGSGNALADLVVEPGTFTAIKFSISTNPVEPQTKAEVDPPTITVKDGKLSGDTSAIVGEWNNQAFAQGSPKPDGSKPGLTRAVHGTYDEDTKRFVLEWSSQVVGGAFNDFTGVWHLEGTFHPA